MSLYRSRMEIRNMLLLLWIGSEHLFQRVGPPWGRFGWAVTIIHEENEYTGFRTREKRVYGSGAVSNDHT